MKTKTSAMDPYDRNLAAAFDEQAEEFEHAPVQTDAAALLRLVTFAALPAGASVLDAGCGPGLVSEALLDAGYRVRGVDLSTEMIARARRRCARFGDRARFDQMSMFELPVHERFEASVSRYVLHHVADPHGFVRSQVERLSPGGIVVASDHVADGDPGAARWHQEIERSRDRTHTRNLTAGELVDLFGAAGLVDIRLAEESFVLEFDEWFDRGTPSESKCVVRERVLSGHSRSFEPELRPDGTIRLACVRALVRGMVPKALEKRSDA